MQRMIGIGLLIWGFITMPPAQAAVEELAQSLAQEMITFEQALSDSNLADPALPELSIIEIYAAASVGVGLPFSGGIEVVPEIEMTLERVKDAN